MTRREKLLSGYPSEVIYMMDIAREKVYHSGVQPKGGAFYEGDPPDKSGESSGLARSDRNVSGAANAPSSLGVRFWEATMEDPHDVYNEPRKGGQKEVSGTPFITMGSLKFNEESDEDLSMTEYGQKFSNQARLIIPKIHHLENDIPSPKEGDLVEFWADDWEKFGVFYDVVKVNDSGRINTTPYHVEWKLRLSRNEEFVPERRYLGNR